MKPPYHPGRDIARPPEPLRRRREHSAERTQQARELGVAAAAVLLLGLAFVLVTLLFAAVVTAVELVRNGLV